LRFHPAHRRREHASRGIPRLLRDRRRRRACAEAEKHFDQNAPRNEIGPEGDFIRAETKRLRALYPKVAVAPLLDRVEDDAVAVPQE